MLDWWLENGPPVYVSVASYLGLTKPSTSSSQVGDLGDLIKMADKGGNIS